MELTNQLVNYQDPVLGGGSLESYLTKDSGTKDTEELAQHIRNVAAVIQQGRCKKPQHSVSPTPSFKEVAVLQQISASQPKSSGATQK